MAPSTNERSGNGARRRELSELSNRPKCLEPGSTIGILGGGQLGRMLSMAAARIGMRCHIYSDAETSPAGEVSAKSFTGDYTDAERLKAFAADVDVITYEFENVPVETAELLQRFRPVYPPPKALEVSQDRLEEKSFIHDLGISVAPFAAVDDEGSLQNAIEEVGVPSILKTRRLGYDGKGQARLRDHSDARSAHAQLGSVPSILEGMIKFDAEMSVLLVRGGSKDVGADDAVVAYDIPRNTHRDGILHQSIVPMDMGVPHQQCIEIASKIADALDYVGVLAVEMFLVQDGGEAKAIVNEIAPRVHNSGHWTMDACLVDQFENHMRAICGWPLGASTRHNDVVMTNLIGDDANRWPELARAEDYCLHLYGKHEARAGRKMGHVNRLLPLSAKR